MWAQWAAREQRIVLYIKVINNNNSQTPYKTTNLLLYDSILGVGVIEVRTESCDWLNPVHSWHSISVHQIPLVHNGKITLIHPWCQAAEAAIFRYRNGCGKKSVTIAISKKGLQKEDSIPEPDCYTACKLTVTMTFTDKFKCDTTYKQKYVYCEQG